jgi:hypothetical protein
MMNAKHVPHGVINADELETSHSEGIGSMKTAAQYLMCRYLVIVLLGCSFASARNIDWEGQVEGYGFSIETDESVQDLLDSGEVAAQHCAIRALAASKPKEEAIAAIKRFLALDSLKVRAVAASQLADLGDRSGLEPMQKAFREWVPPGFLEEKGVLAFVWIDYLGREAADGVIAEVDSRVILDVATALAKLGDPQVGRFVELAAKRAPSAACRSRAVIALGHMAANVSKQQLDEHKLHPDLVLGRVAESEDNPSVRNILLSEVMKPHIKSKLAERVFERMQYNRHLTAVDHRALKIAGSKKVAQAQSTTRPAGCTTTQEQRVSTE